VDDILDVTGNPELMGKNTGMDENKMTWVALRGVEQARRDAEDHIRQAVKALQGLPWDTSFFESIARENLSRAY
jgi:geranylgeranyl pyrophosphate synthase